MLSKTTNVKTLFLVIACSFLIALSLTIATWNINPWPTDAEVYYMPAAKELSSLKYLSQINNSLDEERIKWLHGKELHVLGIWFFQQLLHDSQSLRPLMLLGITCIFGSSILLFLIASRIWLPKTALIMWLFFITSFWPYLYVLFAKHQTQGLFFFLASVFFILYSNRSFFIFLAGALMGVSLFSSTVSTLYLPYIVLAFWYLQKNFIKNSIVFAVGITLTILWVNFPDIIGNIKSYLEYIRISSAFNHFYYNQKNLVQWLPNFNLQDTRGGWAWIIQYFFLVMPIVFSLYLLSIVYLVRRHFNWKTIILIAFSFSSPVLAEIKHIAQYGANYFTSFMGILLLIAVALNLFLKDATMKPYWRFIPWILVVQFLFNAYIFTNDVYPSRLSTTLISDKISELNIKQLYTLPNHPFNNNFVDNLNPALKKELKIQALDTIGRVSSGYIFLAPPSTDSIYRASNGDYTIFDDDLILNQIIRKGKLKDYAVGSFKTLSSSLIWSQEEEILAYRYLVLKQFKDEDVRKAWILDASLIKRDIKDLFPTSEDLFLLNNKIKNIGTSTKIGMHKGYQGYLNETHKVQRIGVRLYKVGDPKDSLKAYLFKVDDKQPTWIPISKDFQSLPVSASQIKNNAEGSLVVFEFPSPITLNPGGFMMVIYRTGSPDDANYYRMWEEFIKLQDM